MEGGSAPESLMIRKMEGHVGAGWGHTELVYNRLEIARSGGQMRSVCSGSRVCRRVFVLHGGGAT